MWKEVEAYYLVLLHSHKTIGLFSSAHISQPDWKKEFIKIVVVDHISAQASFSYFESSKANGNFISLPFENVDLLRAPTQ